MVDPFSSHEAVADFKKQIIVEELDTDLFRGSASPDTPGRVFGGQVIAQALAAATAGFDADRVAHSLHAYFMRAGDNTKPIIYRVIRDFDGGSFSNRRVVALQNGKPILNLAASFQKREEGLTHHAMAPALPGPEEAIPMAQFLTSHGAKIPEPIASRLAAFDIRTGVPTPQSDSASGMPVQHTWFQLGAELGEDLARISLAYVSDFGLVSTAIIPHGIPWFSSDIQGASLDHAIWFHEDPPLGEWLLYVMDSPWSGHARGFTRGSVYDQSGRLIASMTQEGLMRHRPRERSAG